jgi:hypothetical protein
MLGAYFNKLRDEGYEISIQGCKQGSLMVHDDSVKMFADLNLPESVIEAAKQAGAADFRVSIREVAEDLQHKDTMTAKQLDLISAQIEEATETPIESLIRPN